MHKLQPIATFRTGYAGTQGIIVLSGAMDAFDPEEPYTRIYIYNENGPNLWTFNQHDFVVPALALWDDPANPGRRVFVAVSEEGDVAFLAPQIAFERIADAGVSQRSAAGYGYLSDIQQIGEHLYVCGNSGQVYRRNQKDDWAHLDRGLLQSPARASGEYFIAAINGPSEQEIYVVGSENLPGHPARADWWDGAAWHRIDLPGTAGRLTNIYVEAGRRIWLCGARGTLLVGNAATGFAALEVTGSAPLISSVTRFGDALFLATNLGLFRLDPKDPHPALEKVSTGLRPELTDANVVQSVDDVLWSIGPKDLARYDGQRWERVDHPDNPAIGAP